MTKVAEMVRSTFTPESAAKRGAGDDQPEHAHQRHGGHHDEDLDVGEIYGEPAFVEDLIAAGDHRLQRLDPRALRHLDEILENDRHADGGDQRREAEGFAQRPVGDALHGPSPHGGEQHGDDEDEHERERNKRQAEAHDQKKSDQRDESAHHEDVAMGEIDHADDAIDHGVADGDQAVDRAERNPVDQLLQEVSH